MNGTKEVVVLKCDGRTFMLPSHPKEGADFYLNATIDEIYDYLREVDKPGEAKFLQIAMSNEGKDELKQTLENLRSLYKDTLSWACSYCVCVSKCRFLRLASFHRSDGCTPRAVLELQECKALMKRVKNE